MSRHVGDDFLTDLPEVRFGLAETALVVAVIACERFGLGVPTGLVVLAAVTAAACLALPARFAAAVGVSAWAFLTGFVVNTGGQLSLAAADLERMALMVATGVLAALVPALSRRARAAVVRGRARPVAAPHG